MRRALGVVAILLGFVSLQTSSAQSEALEGKALQTVEGFVAERLYSIPKERGGSWVSMTFDDRGRILASDQYGGLYRVTLPGSEGEDLEVETLDLDIGEAQGLLWAEGGLYVVVNGAGQYSSGLYRIEDDDGDGELDGVERLSSFDGSGEHGPHAVVLGPDKTSLYVVAGNHTNLPPLKSSRVPLHWSEDLLLPRRPDPNGHAVGKMAPGGWIARSDLGGEGWELVASGMRNAYDLAFDRDGELFTFDSDMEWDIGLPWYRPTRILHVTSGAEYGWRHGSGKWPVSYPDSLPGVVGLGPASPTGIVMGTDSSFPDRWSRALFVGDWAYGIVYAVHLEKKGSSFTGSFETFLQGEPFPVTDMAFGPDGALYLTTGGRRLQSGLYRVRWEGEGTEPSAEHVVSEDTQEAVTLRRLLESFHGRQDPAVVDLAWAALSHEDRWIRYGARTALEHQPPEQWAARALQEEEANRSVVSILALVRGGGGKWGEAIADRIQEWPLEEWDGDLLGDALRTLGLSWIRREGFSQSERIHWGYRLLSMYPRGDLETDRELTRLLVHLDAEGAGRVLLAAALATSSQEEQIFYADALSSLDEGWEGQDRLTYAIWMDRVSETWVGGHSVQRYGEEIASDVLSALPPEQKTFVEAIRRGRHPAEQNKSRTREDLSVPVTRDWAVDELLKTGKSGLSGRNYAPGQQAFVAARCAECHRLAGAGGSSGPDLSGLAGRYSFGDLLVSVVEPSAALSDQYQDTQLFMKDGSLIMGRLMEEKEDRLILRSTSPTSERIEVLLKDVEERRLSEVSSMPEGLINHLTEEQVLDLMAYLMAGGDPADDVYVSRQSP